MKFFEKAFRNPYFLIGSIMLIIVFLFSFIGVFYTPYDPEFIDTALQSAPPGILHLFGTDSLGRDVFSRLMDAGKYSFFGGLLSVLISLLISLALGLAAGFLGGIWDIVLTKITDIMRSIPGTLFALMIIAVLGKGFKNTIIAVCFLTIPVFFRIIRSNVYQIKNYDYIIHTDLIGLSFFRVCFFHILPNIMSPLIVMSATGIANAIMIEASLSYLDLSIQPPAASFGKMLSEAQENIFFAPWEVLAVGFCISFMVLAFNLLGDGLRDVLDVKN